MNPREERHYSEEELLMHLLGEEVPEMRDSIDGHLSSCGQCDMVFEEYRQVRKTILGWQVPEVPERDWETRRAQLLRQFREERLKAGKTGLLPFLVRFVRGTWNYALENPLPTLGYVIVAIAFASERTITIFRLDRILPQTNEVLAILRQVL